MVDCSKSIVDLSPYDAWQCFKEAKDWEIVGKNSHRMWESFTTTTIGEWGEIIVAVALAPALCASYLLPFYFVSFLIQKLAFKRVFVLDGKERKRKSRWGLYLLVSGLILLLMHTRQPDRFILFQGGFEVFCAIAIFFLPPIVWAKRAATQETT